MAKKLSPFEQAFADARSSGEKTFEFNGKKYGTATMGDVQKKVDAMPSMSRTTGVTVTTQGATNAKDEAPKPKARSLMDQGRGVALYKDVDKEAVLEAGLGLASLNPAVRVSRAAYTAARPVIGAVAKKIFGEDAPLQSILKDKEPPLFGPGKKKSDDVFGDASPRDFKKGGKVTTTRRVSTGERFKKAPNW